MGRTIHRVQTCIRFCATSGRWLMIVPTLPRGNASTDALRSALEGTRSVPGCIPMQSVGTIKRWVAFARSMAAFEGIRWQFAELFAVAVGEPAQVQKAVIHGHFRDVAHVAGRVAQVGVDAFELFFCRM